MPSDTTTDTDSRDDTQEPWTDAEKNPTTDSLRVKFDLNQDSIREIHDDDGGLVKTAKQAYIIQFLSTCVTTIAQAVEDERLDVAQTMVKHLKRNGVLETKERPT